MESSKTTVAQKGDQRLEIRKSLVMVSTSLVMVPTSLVMMLPSMVMVSTSLVMVGTQEALLGGSSKTTVAQKGDQRLEIRKCDGPTDLPTYLHG